MVKKEPDDLLGPIEALVLTAVTKLGDNAYGISIFNLIKEKAYRQISFASVYTSLERMTWKGYLETHMGETKPVRGGRARKCHRITQLGERILQFNKKMIQALDEAPLLPSSPNKGPDKALEAKL